MTRAMVVGVLALASIDIGGQDRLATVNAASPPTAPAAPRRLTFLNTAMSDVVARAGWHNWDRPEREKTARFAEFGNSGPGANTEARVSWAKRLTPRGAAALSPAAVLRGTDGWNPLGVPARLKP
jgi:hypothetical protein